MPQLARTIPLIPTLIPTYLSLSGDRQPFHIPKTEIRDGVSIAHPACCDVKSRIKISYKDFAELLLACCLYPCKSMCVYVLNIQQS